MILIVSHFAKNKGTTDFLVDYFKKNNTAFYLLKHPFLFADSQFSELYLFSDGKETLISRYKKSNNEIINLAKNFFISFLVSFKLRKKINKVLCFGSFNVVPFIPFKEIFKCKIYFWGVDYSRRRFKNVFLNKIYYLCETLACENSAIVFSHTTRQAEARIAFHSLDPKKSRIAPTGYELSPFKFGLDSRNKHLTLFYLGSITEEHGILDFLRYFYIGRKISFPLFIVGSGRDQDKLTELIQSHDLGDVVTFFGYKNQAEIREFLLAAQCRFIGIAPYNDAENDHVYYGDSIKIKEYLNYGMPYITSSCAFVQPDLKSFGFIYEDFSDLKKFFESDILDFGFNHELARAALSAYTWESICQNVHEIMLQVV